MLHERFNRCLNEIRNGNMQGLEDIYNEYYYKMVTTALSKVKDHFAAEDIASDFIAYILEKAVEINYIENPSAWIYQSIRNLAVSYIRKDSRTTKMAVISKESFSKEEPSRVFNLDFHFDFVNSFINLPEYERELVLLHYSYGMKYKEIALILNKPVGTIKRQMHSTKQKIYHLKKYL